MGEHPVFGCEASGKFAQHHCSGKSEHAPSSFGEGGLRRGSFSKGKWAARLDVSPMAASQMIARRSFEPQCGPARDVASVDSMLFAPQMDRNSVETCTSSSERQAEPKAKLTRPSVPLAIRQLRDFNPGLSPRPNLHERK